MSIAFRASLLVLPLMLAACGGGTPDAATAADALDQDLADAGTGNGADPMIASALADPIMVDSALSTRANADAIRPPAQPYAALIPSPNLVAAPAPDNGKLDPAPAPTRKDCPQCAVADAAVTLGALAARQADPAMKACAPQVRYAAGWANRLGPDIPLYNNARVVEAAGVQTAQCRLRLVSFNVAQPVAVMLDWYHTRARAAGYTSDHQTDGAQHVLSGARAQGGGGGYVAYMTTRADGGTDIDLISSAGV